MVRQKGQQINKDRGPQGHHIKKKAGPAVGSYNVRESLEKAVEPNKTWFFKKGPKTNFIEQHAKAKKFIPGVGKYGEKADMAFTKLSTPVTSLRRRR